MTSRQDMSFLCMIMYDAIALWDDGESLAPEIPVSDR